MNPRRVLLITVSFIVACLSSRHARGQQNAPMPTIIGAWKGIQNANERIEFSGDDTAKLSDAQGLPVAQGIYTFTDYRGNPDHKMTGTLEIRLSRPAGSRRDYRVGLLAESLLILLDARSNASVYQRIVGQQIPKAMNVRAYPRWIVGDWIMPSETRKSISLLDDEWKTLLYDPRFVGDAAEPDDRKGFYVLNGDRLELTTKFRGAPLTLKYSIITDGQALILIQDVPVLTAIFVRRLERPAARYYHSGRVWSEKKEYEKAIADYSEAIRLDPKHAGAHNGLAWILATCTDARYRDGGRAVELAKKACELSEWSDANVIDTLAAAYAEVGDFDAAVKWESKAIELLGDRKMKEDLRSRLELYRERKPYRETVSAAPLPRNAADINALVRGLKSSDVGERVGAALSLKKMGASARAARPALAEMAKNDPEVALRELANDCLAVIGEVTPLRNVVHIEEIKPKEVQTPKPIKIEIRKPITIHIEDPVAKAKEKKRKEVGGDLYSVVTIHNGAPSPINYEYRWGNGEWRPGRLDPDKGRSYSHKYKYVNEHKSPGFEVRFDRNVSPNNAWIVYRLERNPSPSKNPDFGRRYDFQQSESDPKYIVLKER